MEPGGSMPHSQGLSNNPYPEPNQPDNTTLLTVLTHLCSLSELLYAWMLIETWPQLRMIWDNKEQTTCHLGIYFLKYVLRESHHILLSDLPSAVCFLILPQLHSSVLLTFVNS